MPERLFLYRSNVHPLDRSRARECGNTLLFAAVTFTLLFAIVAAQTGATVSNQRQANFFSLQTSLRNYAEVGVARGVHQIKNGISSEPGFVGTETWDEDQDYGADGKPGTYDEGEGDLIPTIGEPNVFAVSVGPAELGAGLIIYTEDTAFAGVQRVVASASNGDETVTVTRMIMEEIVEVPHPGAVYVSPNRAVWTLGNTFRIDGNDINPDGSAGPAAAVPGLATNEAGGANQAAILAQIPSNRQDQFDGLGGVPSIDEVPSFNVTSLINQFSAVATHTPASAEYSVDGGNWGNYDAGDFVVTHVEGSLHLSGNFEGAGVLIVDGTFIMTGKSKFIGLVLVSGDAILAGGGNGVHTYGAVMVDGDLIVAGQADHFYSSAVLDAVDAGMGNGGSTPQVVSYETAYYDE